MFLQVYNCPTLNADLERWLTPRTRQDPHSGCRLWLGALFDGYPYGRLPGQPTCKIPRALYRRVHGPLEPGTAVRQTCGNRACCELAHLVAAGRGEAVLAGQGAGAKNARKTACKRGHPFDAANTYRDPAGRRRCRTCMLMAERRWHASVGRKTLSERFVCDVG